MQILKRLRLFFKRDKKDTRCEGIDFKKQSDKSKDKPEPEDNKGAQDETNYPFW